MREIVINKNFYSTPFEGWGTSLCWWAHVIGNWQDENKVNEICDLIFDEDKGLGLNIIRYNFGAGEFPPNHLNLREGANIPAYKISPNEWKMNADSGQRKILMKSIDRGVNIKEAFLNSPPLWMTHSNSTAGESFGGNNLRKDCYEDFVNYIVELLELFNENYGVKFESLAPFNEPSSIWWVADNDQEGCHYSVESQNEIIELINKFSVQKGLYPIKLSAPECWSIHETITTYLDYTNKIKESVDQINTHTYFVDDDRRKLLNKIAEKYKKDLWMSEVCYASNTKHNHEEYESGLIIATNIIKDLKLLKPSAWVYWQVVENEELNHNYGFIQAFFKLKEEFFITKSYYYFAQFTKFIRPKMKVINISEENVVGAYDEESKKYNIIILNPTKAILEYSLKVESGNYSYSITRTSPQENLKIIKQGILKDLNLIVETTACSVTSVSIQY